MAEQQYWHTKVADTTACECVYQRERRSRQRLSQRQDNALQIAPPAILSASEILRPGAYCLYGIADGILAGSVRQHHLRFSRPARMMISPGAGVIPQR
jgi:hypothetical protein